MWQACREISLRHQQYQECRRSIQTGSCRLFQKLIPWYYPPADAIVYDFGALRFIAFNTNYGGPEPSAAQLRNERNCKRPCTARRFGGCVRPDLMGGFGTVARLDSAGGEFGVSHYNGIGRTAAGLGFQLDCILWQCV